MRLQRVLKSKLNTLFLFELEDGHSVEAVHYRGDTLCVSTQVGCALGCGFCASGKAGLLRNLTTEEILKQYEIASLYKPVKRIAVAGIGEPLMNWKNVKKAFNLFKEKGLKVSFYTTGHPVKYLPELLGLPHNGVTISVHSLREEVRKKLIPHGGDLKELLGVLRASLRELPRRRKKKVSLGYLLLKGVNDSEKELRKLGELALELGVGVTLLYYNEVSVFKPVSNTEYERAFLLLRSMGVRVTLSTRFRKDKLGGCGTLLVDREKVGGLA